MFNLTFLQSLPLAEEVYSDCKRYGDFEWQLCWRLLHRSNRALIVFAYPIENIIRPDVDWKVEADITGKVGSTSFTEKNVKLFSKTENGKKSSYGFCSYMRKEQIFLKEHETLEEGVLVSLEVSNIWTKGLRKFPMIDDEPFDSGYSDLIIRKNNKTINGYSQILRMNSMVFRRTIEEMTPPYVITLEDSIDYDDFLELLHHIYHPAEVIDEHNLRTILPLATKFEATQTLEICQRFLKKCLLKHTVDKDSKIEYFFLAWKNDVEPLKTDCIEFLFPWDELSLTKLRHKQLYQNLDENQKLELLECLIMISEPVSAHSNKLAWWGLSSVYRSHFE